MHLQKPYCKYKNIGDKNQNDRKIYTMQHQFKKTEGTK